jgi:hypothetical protein
MSKRVKINFETVNKGRYEIIPPAKIAESRERIKQNMKAFIRKLNVSSFMFYNERVYDKCLHRT